MMRTSTDFGRLRATQLDLAAADLRNAARVLRHTGHYQGALIEKFTGKVCMVGAIELATYKYLRTDEYGAYAGITRHYWINDGIYRCDAAISVLADSLPTELCDKCHTAEDTFEAWEAVVHYNDNHCVLSEISINMLYLAADRAAGRAEELRAWAGRVLDAVPA
jgi:hypothetical protein